MHMRPQREGHFPDVIYLQVSLVHRRCDGISDRVQSGRSSRPKVLGEPPRSRTRPRKDIIKHARPFQRVIDVPFHHPNKPHLRIPTQRVRQNVLQQLRKFAIGDVVEQPFTPGKVVINRHGRDAHRAGHSAHADRLGALGFQDLESRLGDLFSSGFLRYSSRCRIHLYIVYYTPYSYKRAIAQASALRSSLALPELWPRPSDLSSGPWTASRRSKRRRGKRPSPPRRKNRDSQAD